MEVMKAGSLVYWTMGEYSSYGVAGVYRLKRDLNVYAECERIMEERKFTRWEELAAALDGLYGEYLEEVPAEELRSDDPAYEWFRRNK